MMDYINPPELRPWTEDDIREEYVRIRDRRKVAKIYDIPLREANRILNNGGKMKRLTCRVGAEIVAITIDDGDRLKAKMSITAKGNIKVERTEKEKKVRES